MRSFRNVVVLASVAALFSLAGCASNKAASGADSKVAVINTVCPIAGDDFESKERQANLVRTVDGKNIGFCCDHCTTKFDKMSDDKKKAALAAATANKAM